MRQYSKGIDRVGQSNLKYYIIEQTQKKVQYSGHDILNYELTGCNDKNYNMLRLDTNQIINMVTAIESE